jgi:hypothetical protein
MDGLFEPAGIGAVKAQGRLAAASVAAVAVVLVGAAAYLIGAKSGGDEIVTAAPGSSPGATTAAGAGPSYRDPVVAGPTGTTTTVVAGPTATTTAVVAAAAAPGSASANGTPAVPFTPPAAAGNTTGSARTNNPPTLDLAARTNDELQSVDVALAADPDGDTVSLTVLGLPSGLTVGGAKVTGTIPHDAATTTSDRRTGIMPQTYTVTVTATDSYGASTTGSFTWTVRDTHRLMPNYIDQYGCGGCGGLPDVAAVSTPIFDCAYSPGSDGNHIFRQSVAPGSVIAWGRSISYWYGDPRPTCTTVPKGW